MLRACDEEGLAGVLGTIRVDFSVAGSPTPGLWLALWFNAKNAAAGTGLMLLRAAMEADAQVVACLGFNDIAERIYRGLRFNVVDELPRWIRLANADAFRALMAMGKSEPAAELEATIERLGGQPHGDATAGAQIVAWDEGLAEPGTGSGTTIYRSTVWVRGVTSTIYAGGTSIIRVSSIGYFSPRTAMAGFRAWLSSDTSVSRARTCRWFAYWSY